MTRTLVVLSSGNTKTGQAAVTYRTQDSCPPECPLYAAGCYARGRIFGIPTRLGAEGPTADGIASLAEHMPQGAIMRANVSGDVLKREDDGTYVLDQEYVDSLSTLAADRPDVDVYTYTHAWRRFGPDIAPGVTVNASCETADDIERAAAAGWPTVVADPGPDDPATLIGQTIAGRKVVQCPAQTRGLTCEQCRLCARPQRRSTVAFAVHGGGRAQARRAVAQRREVDPQA